MIDLSFTAAKSALDLGASAGGPVSASLASGRLTEPLCSVSVRHSRLLHESTSSGRQAYGYSRGDGRGNDLSNDWHRVPNRAPTTCGRSCEVVCDLTRGQSLDNSQVHLCTVFTTARSTEFGTPQFDGKSPRSIDFLKLFTDPQDLLPLLYFYKKYRSIRGPADRDSQASSSPPDRTHHGYRDKGIPWSSGSSKPNS